MDGRLIIDNRRVETQQKIKSINPSTLEPVGEACLASSEECQKAVEAAKRAFPIWRSLPLEEKKKTFQRAKKILFRRRNEVAHLSTVEK